MPFDPWYLHEEIPPPFESIAEKEWVKEDKASPYTWVEKPTVNLMLGPGIVDLDQDDWQLYRRIRVDMHRK
jgi:hypothetical protein